MKIFLGVATPLALTCTTELQSEGPENTTAITAPLEVVISFACAPPLFSLALLLVGIALGHSAALGRWLLGSVWSGWFRWLGWVGLGRFGSDFWSGLTQWSFTQLPVRESTARPSTAPEQVSARVA
jgi:hypothetical protein